MSMRGGKHHWRFHPDGPTIYATGLGQKVRRAPWNPKSGNSNSMSRLLRHGKQEPGRPYGLAVAGDGSVWLGAR